VDGLAAFKWKKEGKETFAFFANGAARSEPVPRHHISVACAKAKVSRVCKGLATTVSS
jgi:hypothetical protein